MNGELNIGLLGDLHYDGGREAAAALEAALERLAAVRPELLVVVGDLVHSSGADEAAALLGEIAGRCAACCGEHVRYLPGNHDLDFLSKEAFFRALGRNRRRGVFSFTLAGVGLVGLDANFSPDGTEYREGNFTWEQSFVPPAQLDWLRERLAALPAPVVVFVHQQLTGEGRHAVQNGAAVREIIRRSGKVAAVVQAHRHATGEEEIDGTVYYSLGAHCDGAAPACLRVRAGTVRLERMAAEGVVS